jgi:hypothetical protein
VLDIGCSICFELAFAETILRVLSRPERILYFRVAVYSGVDLEAPSPRTILVGSALIVSLESFGDRFSDNEAIGPIASRYPDHVVGVRSSKRAEARRMISIAD